MEKKKIAWITDSTAYIPDHLRDHPDVYSVPIGIIFGEQVYEDGIELTTEQLYEKIKNDKTIPKTSQPSVGLFAELYEKLKQNYDSAVAIHVSNKLSGTIESSRGGKEIADFNVEVIDSLSISSAITILIEKGMELEEKGLEQQEIASILRQAVQETENYILIGNLNQLYKGGRMNSAQYLLGSMLKIKPILQINKEGELNVFEKVRSEKKAVNRILEKLKKDCLNSSVTRVYIMHGNNIEKAFELKTILEEQFQNMEIIIGDISSSIGVHAGEGTLGLVWHKE